eukprot:2144289-Lingulodinium_polyedra.AAC.1
MAASRPSEDLLHLLAGCSVPEAHQKILLEQGFDTVARFALFGDTRKEVREALGGAPFNLDLAASDVPAEEKMKRRSAQAKLVE